MSRFEIVDGPLKRVIEIDPDGQARSQLQQPNRGTILNRNAELRKNPGAIRDTSFMGLEYDVPLADYFTITRAIKRHNPGAGSRDMSALLKGWLQKYGQQYKVR